MMIKRFLSAVLVLFFSAETVGAQVIDMRAYSRQRGFKAYQAPVPVVPVKRMPRRSAAARPADDAQEESVSVTRGNGASDAEIADEQEKIQQTGLKIFQEKDEDKVLKFDVENPEFKKLNKSQQQSLVKRISYE